MGSSDSDDLADYGYKRRSAATEASTPAPVSVAVSASSSASASASVPAAASVSASVSAASDAAPLSTIASVCSSALGGDTNEDLVSPEPDDNTKIYHHADNPPSDTPHSLSLSTGVKNDAVMNPKVRGKQRGRPRKHPAASGSSRATSSTLGASPAVSSSPSRASSSMIDMVQESDKDPPILNTTDQPVPLAHGSESLDYGATAIVVKPEIHINDSDPEDEKQAKEKELDNSEDVCQEEGDGDIEFDNEDKGDDAAVDNKLDEIKDCGVLAIDDKVEDNCGRIGKSIVEKELKSDENSLSRKRLRSDSSDILRGISADLGENTAGGAGAAKIETDFDDELSELGSLDLEQPNTSLVTTQSELKGEGDVEDQFKTIMKPEECYNNALIGMTERRNTQQFQTQSVGLSGNALSASSSGVLSAGTASAASLAGSISSSSAVRRGGRPARVQQPAETQPEVQAIQAPTPSFAAVIPPEVPVPTALLLRQPASRPGRKQSRQASARGGQSSGRGNRGRRAQEHSRGAAQAAAEVDSPQTAPIGNQGEMSATAEGNLKILDEEIKRMGNRLRAITAKRENTQSIIERFAGRIQFFESHISNPTQALGPVIRAELAEVASRLEMSAPVIKASKSKIDLMKNLQECRRLHERGTALLAKLLDTERLCEEALLELTRDCRPFLERLVLMERDNELMGVPAASSAAAAAEACSELEPASTIEGSQPLEAADSGATIDSRQGSKNTDDSNKSKAVGGRKKSSGAQSPQSQSDSSNLELLPPAEATSQPRNQ